MFIKQVVAVMLVSSLICNAADRGCSVRHVEPNSLKQTRTLIRQYDNAKNAGDKQCKEQAMRDLLAKLITESGDFGGAVKAGAMGGELEASNVNLNEKVGLDASIKLLQERFATIDGQKPSSLRKMSQEVESKKEYTSLKRKRATN